jgi:hypothetical protein
MFALTILYCILFFYIRIQLKNFKKAASSSDLQSSNELQCWQANLEAGNSTHNTAPHDIVTIKTVHVTTEERPQRPNIKSDADRAHKRMNQVALTLLCYPIIYICLTMPLCITRLSEFAGKEWSLAGIYAGASIFCCTGFMNVLVYTLTRKGIISWDWLFRSRRQREDSRLSNVSSNPPPPPYHSHFPGSRLHSKSGSMQTPASVTSKPSVISIESLCRNPSTSRPVRHDADSDFDFQFTSSYSGTLDVDNQVSKTDVQSSVIPEQVV